MDKQRWKQIDAVFEQALEIEPGERAAGLARMCAGDDDLRRRGRRVARTGRSG